MAYNLTNISNAVAYNEKLYFVPANYNSLFEIDINNRWRVKCVHELSWTLEGFGVKCFLAGEKIWCVALQGIEIFSYDLTTMEEEYFRFDEIKERENITTILRDDMIWIFPRNIPDHVVRFSVSEQMFYIDDGLFNVCEEKQVTGRIVSSSIDENSVAMVLQYTNSILMFCFDTNQFTFMIIPVRDALFSIAHEKNFFYFTTEVSRKLIVWDIATDSCNIYEDLKYKDSHYIKVLKINQGLLLTDGIRMQAFDGNVIKDFGVKEIENSCCAGSHFMSVMQYKGKNILMPWNANKALEIEEGFQNLVTHQLVYPNIVAWARKIKNYSEFEASLHDYIFGIENMNQTFQSSKARAIGLAIYENCRMEGIE